MIKILVIVALFASVVFFRPMPLSGRWCVSAPSDVPFGGQLPRICIKVTIWFE